MAGLKETNFQLHPEQEFYKGKVRDVYYLGKKIIVVATDRISAFDHILPKPIPYKGQMLNEIATHFLEASKDIVPNWLEATPDPNVSVGKRAEPIMIEMVVRGYLAGHSWREYKAGKRVLCGVVLPEGMKEADKFPTPIITPATKAEEGHDEDISAQEILSKGIVKAEVWDALCRHSFDLFELGTKMAAERGLILVDTKYEFGTVDGKIILIDEIHTPDSSRYYIKEGYEDRQVLGEKQKQLSKEFVREWLMENGFQGLEGQVMPVMPDTFVTEVTDRYMNLYHLLLGKTFEKAENEDIEGRILENLKGYLEIGS